MPQEIKSHLRILHLEDNPTDAELIREMLEQEGFDLEVVRTATEIEFQHALEREPFDLILSDFSLPSYNGMRALMAARQLRPEIPFVFFSGTIGEETAVESLKNGATDYVLKHRPQKLISAVQRALREAKDRRLREEAERTLQRREKWFRALTENALDVVSILDREGRFKYNSLSIERVLGYSPQELIGRDAFDLIHPDDVSKARQTFQQTIEHPDQRMTLEFRFQHKDGSWRNLEAVGQSLLSDPEISGIVVNSRDTSERRQAEQRYRSIFNNAVEGICQTTPEGKFITANPALAEMLGYDSPEELMGQIQDLATQVYAQYNQRTELKRRIDQDGFVKGFECQARNKDGGEVWISINARAIRDAEGKLLYHDCSIQDITVRKQAEERYLRAQRMECIGVLAGGIAHDLNNILAPVLMASEILLQKLQSEEDRNILDIVKSSAERGSDMVKQILSFARGVEGESTLIELKHLIRDVAKFLKETFPPSIQIETEVARDLLPLKGNATQLHQVLMNLCVNARDAMPQGGILRLKTKNVVLEGKLIKTQPKPVTGSFVLLTVSDTGAGIPADLLDKIFEAFFTTKEVGKGTGLGLATVQSIVKSHQGFVEVSSTQGEGTSFDIYLPAAESGESVPTESSQHSVPLGRGETILVVDDEIAVLQMCKLVLETHNYKVLTAPDGAQAIGVYAQHQKEIKLVITDSMMPIMDGVALIRAMRSIDPNVKVICASGNISQTKLSDQEGQNVEIVLNKPYTARVLLSAVHSVIQARQRLNVLTA